MKINIEKILKVMVICGTVMAVYVILQKFRLDEFWMAKQGYEFTQVHGRTLGGNLGQPTIVASWIVMMIPLAMYLKKWRMAITMAVACLLTEGAMITSALGLIFTISVFYRYPELRLLILIVTLILGIFIGINKPIQHKILTRMDGRSEVWKNTLSDIQEGQLGDKHNFSLTGIGLGRFSFVFPDKHKSPFQQAHNDILEFIYNCGLVGGFLLLAGIFFMIKGINLSPLSFSVLLSFIAILFCSLGSFPFQLGAHQFYSAVLVGILNNDSIIRRV